MQVIHHTKNGAYTIKNNSSVMRGTIKMTIEEWEKCYQKLLGIKKQATKHCDTYTRDGLSNIEKYKVLDYGIDCIGVTATNILFDIGYITNGSKNMQMKNKQINYGIKII